MNVLIDHKSGFCFGVVYAIQMAEKELESEEQLYCLGDIVHNNMEVQRLKEKGLVTIDHEQFKQLRNCKVLLRAHGEPPSTYQIAIENNIQLVDASCPVVLRLQNNIKSGFEETKEENGQIVIFGKQGHAEVNGLVGQTQENAIVINAMEDLEKIDFSRPVRLYSQTTQSMDRFAEICSEIETRMLENFPKDEVPFIANDTICRQVAHRKPELAKFAQNSEVIVFVSGKKSSNGKFLYGVCKENNERTYFVSELNELKKEWFEGIENVGVCGATSTPRWLMEEVAKRITEISSK